MIRQDFRIENIPAILWGEKSDKLFIAIHGNMSNKEADVIVILAQEAVRKGYQILSFDLPGHGARKSGDYTCKVQNCVHDLEVIMCYAQSIANDISVFACSMGAYFSLLAYNTVSIKQCLFLSPVLDMRRIIENIMTWFNINEELLESEKEISTPIGQTLYWDYYCYVKEHPIMKWHHPTAILYGLKDDLCEFDIVSSFASDFQCKLEVMTHGEHYFHTDNQLQFFRDWLKNYIEYTS